MHVTTVTENTARLPRLEPGRIERKQLLARLTEARNKTCWLILGPAGSGKYFIGVAVACGRTGFWPRRRLAHGPARGDNGLALLEPQFDALDRVDPEIAREAWLLYNRDSEVRFDTLVSCCYPPCSSAASPSCWWSTIGRSWTRLA